MNTAISPSATLKRFVDVTSPEDGISIRVYPLSFRELENHSEDLTLIFRSLGAVVRSGQVLNAGTLLTVLGPVAGRQILRIVDSCCVPSLTECRAPWELTVQAAAAWAELSFFKFGSIEKTAVAVERMLKAATGENIDLQTPLKTLFVRDTQSSPSTSTSDSTAIPPAAAGPSPNFTPDSSPPAASRIPDGLLPSST